MNFSQNLMTILVFALCFGNWTCTDSSTKKAATAATPKTATTAAAEKAKTVPAQVKPKAALSNQGVELNFSDTQAKKGTESCVDMTVKQFTDVVSMQYSINWNPKELSYKAVQGFNLKDLSKNNFGTKRIAEGKLTFSWYDQVVKGITVADNTSIYQICFDVIGKKGTNAKILITEDPIIVEITGKGGTFLKLFTDTAKVTVE